MSADEVYVVTTPELANAPRAASAAAAVGANDDDDNDNARANANDGNDNNRARRNVSQRASLQTFLLAANQAELTRVVPPPPLLAANSVRGFAKQ